MKQNYENKRPTIPSEIRRKIETDSGHKCTIKDCNEHTYLEIHHIDLNRENNKVENLILLCDKHHKMAHNGVIDRKSLHLYKEILETNNKLVEKIKELEELSNKLKNSLNFDKNSNYQYCLVFEIFAETEFEFYDLYKYLCPYNFSNTKITPTDFFNVIIEKIEENLFKIYLDTPSKKKSYDIIKILSKKFEIHNIKYKE